MRLLERVGDFRGKESEFSAAGRRPIFTQMCVPVAFVAHIRQCGAMKGLLRIFLFALLALPASAREYKLYAALLDDMPVELSDGAKWMMDKGDVFPVLMFKESQTKVVLQLAGANFLTDTSRVRILENREVPAGLLVYRKNVEVYLKTKVEKWRAASEPKKPDAPAPKQ